MTIYRIGIEACRCNQKFRRIMLYLYLFSASSFLFSSCLVDAPTSDSTKPIVKWVVTNKSTNVQQTIVGSGTIHAGAGDNFQVTFKVQDPQGVHRISVGGSGAYTCISGAIGQTTWVDGVTQEQTLNPNSQNKVLTETFMLTDVNIGSWNCSSGYSWSSGHFTFYGEGENYFSGITTGTLEFKRP